MHGKRTQRTQYGRSNGRINYLITNKTDATDAFLYTCTRNSYVNLY